MHGQQRTWMVAAAAAVMALSACGGGAAPAQSGGAVAAIADGAVTAGTATTEVDNVNWWGDYRPLYSLDPIKLADYPEETAIPNVCEPLVQAGPDYTLSPGLAAAYEFTDPSTLKLTLRQGVLFSDGTPMTSADVAYSLSRNLDPATLSNFGYLFGTVASITAPDPQTVIVAFTAPSPHFVNALASLGGAVVQKAFTEKAGQSFGSPQTGVMCTGPYAFGSYDGTTKLVLTRNEHYWDKARAAKAKTFTFLYTADTSALANALKSGQIDGAYNVPSNLLAELRSATTGKVHLGGPGSTPVNVDILMTRATGTSADPRVRQAMSKVIDRVAIAKTIYNDAADPLYRVSGPGMWGYAKGVYGDAYAKATIAVDVEGAKKLVAEAGAVGKTVTFAYPAGDPLSTKLATVLQQEIKQTGLDFVIVGLPTQQYGALFNDPKAREPYDAIYTRNYFELPEPQQMDVVYGGTGGSTNFSGYSNPAVDAALTQAGQTTDPDARARLVLQAEEQLDKDLPSIPIVAPRAIVFQSSKLAGATLTFSYMVSPWAAAIGGN